MHYFTIRHLKWAIICVVCAALFASNLYLKSVYMGWCYILILLFSFWLKKYYDVYLVAGICTGLLLLDWYLSPPSIENNNATLTLCIILSLIWSFASLSSSITKRAPENDFVTDQNRRNLFLPLLSIFLAASALLIAVLSQQYFATRQQFLQSEASVLSRTKVSETRIFNQLTRDLIILSQLSSVQDADSTPQAAANDFLRYLQEHPSYDQIRILDTNGREIVRANQGVVPQIIATPNLQNKSHRNYFTESKHLKKHEVHLSEINLNREFNKIEHPLKYVLRAVTPIYRQGEKKGYLIINYTLNKALEPFTSSNNSSEYSYLEILDHRGYWFGGVAKDLLYNTKEAGSPNLKKQKPEVWKKISNAEEGHFESSGNYFLFSRIYFEAENEFPDRNERSLILLKKIPQKVLYTAGARLATSSLIYYSIFAVLFWIGGYFFMRQKNTTTQSLEQQVRKRTIELESVKNELKQQLELVDHHALISVTDAEGTITYANDTFCEVSQYRKEELIGQNHRILKSGVHPDGMFTGMWKSLKMGNIWRGDICNRKKDGSLYWVATVIKPFVDSSGLIEKFVSVRFDITEWRETQNLLKKLENANAKLDMVNKELETFSYSVSHDLKAPLRALQGFSENFAEHYKDQLDERGVRWLHFIRDNAQQMDALISDILSLARISKKSLKKSTICMTEMIQKQVERAKETFPKEAHVSIDTPHKVHCDPVLMETVWQNLINNAFKYSQKKEKVNIEIWSKEDASEVRFYIRDNGEGFDMRHYDKLFGVFQRLHSMEEFEGSGIGLANVKRIIMRHNGSVTAHGEIGVGSTFQINLPKHHSNATTHHKHLIGRRQTS